MATRIDGRSPFQRLGWIFRAAPKMKQRDRISREIIIEANKKSIAKLREDNDFSSESRTEMGLASSRD
jgi:hypothetical protein